MRNGLKLLPQSVFLTIAVFTLLSFIGCASNECYDNKNSLPLAGFYTSAPQPMAVRLDSVSIYGIGAPGDSILQDSVSGLSQCYLPFRIDQGSTTYVFDYINEYVNNLADTIIFNYEIEPRFVSAACGVVYNYKIESIQTTHNLIDSVTCPDGVITNVSSENLKIYFKYSEEEEAP